MTSTLVIYTTKYGTTETYAKQIATALKADLKEIANVEAHDLIFYDTVIFGAPLYLGKPYHYEKVLDVIRLYPPHLFLTFLVGASHPTEEELKLIKHLLPVQDDHLFYFPGRLDYQTLTLKDKFLMQGLKLWIKGHSKKTADEEGILESFKHPVDLSQESYTQPLINFVNENALN